MPLAPSEITAIRKGLLAWYADHRRDLPWRRSSDPYAVWVSEVMLQQTRVSVVVDYFERWMQRFPTIERLAAASEHDVLHAWQGLGYYSRARRLRQGALFVRDSHAGVVPRSVDELLGIPGVGRYTAGAIASIAHGERAPLVDGNVVRVLCRLFALRGDPAKSALSRTLWDLAAELVPEDRPADFNQALMELGATVCTPRRTQCFGCPLSKKCAALRQGLVDTLPEVAKRPETTRVVHAAAIIEDEGRLLLRRLPEDAPRWAGMWSFPTVELAEGEDARAGVVRAARDLAGRDVRALGELGTVVHQVTRFRVELRALACEALEQSKRSGGSARQGKRAGTSELASFRPDELGALALPAPQRKLARLISATPTPETRPSKRARGRT